jgi:hypothetical protein
MLPTPERTIWSGRRRTRAAQIDGHFAAHVLVLASVAVAENVRSDPHGANGGADIETDSKSIATLISDSRRLRITAVLAFLAARTPRLAVKLASP